MMKITHSPFGPKIGAVKAGQDSLRFKVSEAHSTALQNRSSNAYLGVCAHAVTAPDGTRNMVEPGRFALPTFCLPDRRSAN